MRLVSSIGARKDCTGIWVKLGRVFLLTSQESIEQCRWDMTMAWSRVWFLDKGDITVLAISHQISQLSYEVWKNTAVATFAISFPSCSFFLFFVLLCGGWGQRTVAALNCWFMAVLMTYLHFLFHCHKAAHMPPREQHMLEAERGFPTRS